MSVEIISTENLNEAKGLWAISPNNFNGLIDSHILANQRISELEAQLDSVRALLAAEMQAVEKLGESRDNLNAAFQVARELLTEVNDLDSHLAKSGARFLTTSHKGRIEKALARIEEVSRG